MTAIIRNQPATPFKPGPAPPPPPRPPRRAPVDPELVETAPAARPPTGPVLPFARPGPLVPELAQTAPPTTSPLAPALPFARGNAPGGAEPRLDLQAYAALCAEISVSPTTALATLARHGLTPDGKRAEDAAWKARFDADPQVRSSWLSLVMEAGARLRSGK